MSYWNTPDYEVTYRFDCSCGELNSGTAAVNAGTIDGAFRVASSAEYKCGECGSRSRRDNVIIDVKLLSL